MQALSLCGDSPRPGLAVSGGSDSMAMMRAVAGVAADLGLPPPAVATVDHCLREASASEAVFVAEAALALGLAHQTLTWQDHPQSGNLMQAGSTARYDLLAGWARSHQISHVFLAHTADDQAECFLMGLGRASGLEGLSGMRPAFEHQGICFLRPFLGLGRETLREALRAAGQSWVEDPSNQNPRYQRARLRALLPQLAAEGITAGALNQTIANLAAVQSLLDATLAGAFAAMAEEEGGGITLQSAPFHAAHPELQRRLLLLVLQKLTAARHPPRAAALARLGAALSAGKPATLGGCRFQPKGPAIRIRREGPRSQR